MESVTIQFDNRDPVGNLAAVLIKETVYIDAGHVLGNKTGP